MYDSKKKKKTHLQSITYFPLIKYICISPEGSKN